MPGSGSVGEIILRDLILHHGPRNMAAAIVAEPHFEWRPDPALETLPVRLFPSIHSHAQRPAGRLGAVVSFWNYLTGFRSDVRRLTDEAVEWARGQDVDVVFGVLNYPLMLDVARQVASRLGKPLATLVWDPPEYILFNTNYDRWSRRFLLASFRQSLAAASKVAVISETMQEDYAQFTGAPIGILRHGLPTAESTPAAAQDGDEWVIGFAGAMYAPATWQALLAALDRVDWKIAGRSVRIKVLAPGITLSSKAPCNIEYLGYRSVDGVREALETCHLAYLPQPFEPQFAELCRYAFPTKLSSYLATGVPVFAHCPAESALDCFLRSHPVGVKCHSLDPADIAGALEAFLGDPAGRAGALSQVASTSRSQFDVSVFHAAIDALFETSPQGQ